MASTAAAQWPAVETFSVDDGLPSHQIYAMAEHSSGRLWILSDIGLAVYDGQTFQPAPHAGLRQRWFFRLMTIDRKDTVWIARDSRGSPVFHLEDDRWQALPELDEKDLKDGGLPKLTALAVAQDDGGPRVALGSVEGLWLSDGGPWSRVSEGLPSDRIHDAAVLGDAIAVATAGGLCWLETGRPDCTTRRESPRLEDPILAVFATPSRLWLLAADWLGFLAAGELTIVREGLALSPELSGQLQVDAADGVFYGNRDVIYLAELADSPEPYLGAAEGALQNLVLPEGAVGPEGVTAIASDRESNVWIASLGGLSRVGSRRFLSWRQEQGLLEDDVAAIVETGPGRFVLGHNGGLTLFTEGRTRTLPFAGSKSLDPRVFDLVAEADGTVWAAVRALGFWHLSPEGELQKLDLALDGDPMAVEIGPDGRLWLATTTRIYVRQDADFRPLATQPHTMSVNWLTAGSDGRLYVSTNQGLAVFEEERWTQVEGSTAESNNVVGVLPEASGQVWVGTSAGLYERRGDRLVPAALGEREIRQPVVMIFRDQDDRLWLGTDDGVWIWDGERLRHLSVRHGLAERDTNRGAGIVDHRGNVWIGTEGGLSVYRMRYDLPPTAAPLVELTRLEVNGAPRRLRNLELTYRENNLIWRFRTIAFSREADVAVRYRLEGYDEGWQGPEPLTEVRYTNLPPGSYRFHVVAGWDDGEEGPTAVSAPITIGRPLWREPWLLALVTGIAAAAVFGAHRLRLRSLAARNAELEALTERLKRSIAEKDRLFVELLRAESPAHLAALRDELREIDESARQEARSSLVPHVDFFSELRDMLEGLGSLERLPSSDDRAFVLGQALTRALTLQKRLEKDGGKKPGLDGMALATVQQIFTTALEDVQQRAELELKLRSKQLTARREAMVVVDLTNAGHGDATNVAVELAVDGEALAVPRPRQHLKSLLRGQSARLEFLVEPRGSERARLAFRVTWDDPQKSGQEHRFADVVELRRYQEPAVFRPLRPNPYVVGRPLLPSDLFYGREELFERLRTNLEGAGQDNVVVLIGQRRMGKTSILRRLDRHLPDTYVPVLVDLQGLLGGGEAAFFREVAGQVTDELDERGVQVPEPSAEAFETDPGGVFRRRFLKEVQGALEGRRLLLVFDELEVLEERIDAGELTPQMLPYLRSVMQHEEGVSFLLAGTHRLDELTADYWGVLFNLAIYLEVGHLEEDDVLGLFVEPPRGSFEIDSLALEKIYRTTGGHPHFSQLLARELVEFCNRRKISYVTVQDVNQVVEVVADKGQLHVAYLWDGASRDERLLLLAAKELLEHEGVASLAAARRYLAHRGLGAGDLSEALRRLRRKEILAEKAGQLSFGIDLLRSWLDRHRDLETLTLGREEVGE